MWDAAIYAHSLLGHPEDAAAAIGAMRDRGIPVGYVAHGCVMRAFCEADDFEVGSPSISQASVCHAKSSLNASQQRVFILMAQLPSFCDA